jgi:hypothetical protein
MFLKRLFVGFAIIVISLLSLPHASAADPGSGLTLSPTRGEFVINKGKNNLIEISLNNKSGAPVVAKAEVDDFVADNKTGEPKIQVNTKVDTAASVKKFLSNVGDVSLDTNETKKIQIPIVIPENTVSGSYYGVIRYTATAADSTIPTGIQVGLTASVGYIVLIQVPGNITEQIQAQKIAVSRNGVNGSLFIAPPTQANIVLKNTGNGFTKPFGRVTISKGGKEVFTYEMNDTDPRSIVLPDSSRTFTKDIKNVNTLGRYTIVTGVSYGSGGDVITLKSSFWVFPLWFVIAIGVALIIMIVVIFIIYKRISKKRK